LGFARWRLARRGLEAEFIDLNQQPLPRARFDFLTAVDVCEHLSNPGDEFRRIAQSLKTGGAFVFNHIAGADEERPMHIMTTTAPLLRSLRRNGLREVGAEAASLRRLGFRVVERGGQGRVEDWFYGAYDRLRFSRVFAPGANGRFSRDRARHPLQTYFERVKERLDGREDGREAGREDGRDQIEKTNGTMRWLDLGCGRQLAPGWMKGQAEIEADLKSRASDIIGVDSDLAALRDNRALPSRINADAVRLPFADGSFDLVTS